MLDCFVVGGLLRIVSGFVEEKYALHKLMYQLKIMFLLLKRLLRTCCTLTAREKSLSARFVGRIVGNKLGRGVRIREGPSVGCTVGSTEGLRLGIIVGVAEGNKEGSLDG